MCVCFGAGFGCAPPFLAGALGCVFFSCRRPPLPRQFWLGCAVWVCVLGFGLWLRPANLGRGVGVFVFVCALLLPRHSWFGGAVWLCLIGFGFPLRPAIPGWGVRVGVFLWSLSASTPPILARVCGVGVGAWVKVSAAPCQSWLGRWGVCVCVRAPPVPRYSWRGSWCVGWL